MFFHEFRPLFTVFSILQFSIGGLLWIFFFKFLLNLCGSRSWCQTQFVILLLKLLMQHLSSASQCRQRSDRRLPCGCGGHDSEDSSHNLLVNWGDHKSHVGRSSNDQGRPEHEDLALRLSNKDAISYTGRKRNNCVGSTTSLPSGILARGWLRLHEEGTTTTASSFTVAEDTTFL